MSSTVNLVSNKLFFRPGVWDWTKKTFFCLKYYVALLSVHLRMLSPILLDFCTSLQYAD